MPRKVGPRQPRPTDEDEGKWEKAVGWIAGDYANRFDVKDPNPKLNHNTATALLPDDLVNGLAHLAGQWTLRYHERAPHGEWSVYRWDGHEQERFSRLVAEVVKHRRTFGIVNLPDKGGLSGLWLRNFKGLGWARSTFLEDIKRWGTVQPWPLVAILPKWRLGPPKRGRPSAGGALFVPLLTEILWWVGAHMEEARTKSWRSLRLTGDQVKELAYDACEHQAFPPFDVDFPSWSIVDGRWPAAIRTEHWKDDGRFPPYMQLRPSAWVDYRQPSDPPPWVKAECFLAAIAEWRQGLRPHPFEERRLLYRIVRYGAGLNAPPKKGC